MGVGGDGILTSSGELVDVRKLLERYFCGAPLDMVVMHGTAVARLSLEIGGLLGLVSEEILFLGQAALLHDIGVCRVSAPDIGLYGGSPYIAHGILGREILEREGLPRHALVCERHIGVGLTREDIVGQGLPLPQRDMVPENLAEEIICFADLFYSKNPGALEQMKSPENVRSKLMRFGESKLQIFDGWMQRFGGVFGSRAAE